MKMYKTFSLFIALTFLAASAYAGHGHEVDAHAQITHHVNEIGGKDGHYNFQFQTSNGISMQEQGIGGRYAQGSTSYYSPEGELIELTYTADEHGFQPKGAHLPTPPPIPDEILKSLEYNSAHPEEDDYHEDHHHHQHHEQHHQHHEQHHHGHLEHQHSGHLEHHHGHADHHIQVEEHVEEHGGHHFVPVQKFRKVKK